MQNGNGNFCKHKQEKNKMIIFVFSGKYEAHKVVFSTREANLLGRGYRL